MTTTENIFNPINSLNTTQSVELPWSFEKKVRKSLGIGKIDFHKYVVYGDTETFRMNFTAESLMKVFGGKKYIVKETASKKVRFVTLGLPHEMGRVMEVCVAIDLKTGQTEYVR